MRSSREQIRNRFLPVLAYGSSDSFNKISMVCYKMYRAIVSDLKKTSITESLMEDAFSIIVCIESANESFGSREDMTDLNNIRETLIRRLNRATKNYPELNGYILSVLPMPKRYCS